MFKYIVSALVYEQLHNFNAQFIYAYFRNAEINEIKNRDTKEVSDFCYSNGCIHFFDIVDNNKQCFALNKYWFKTKTKEKKTYFYICLEVNNHLVVTKYNNNLTLWLNTGS